MTSKPLADIIKSFPPLPPLDRGHVTEWLRMIAFIAWCHGVPNRQWADIVIHFVPNDNVLSKGILSLMPTPMMDWAAFEPAASRILVTLHSDVGMAAGIIGGIATAPVSSALQAIIAARTAFVTSSFALPSNLIADTARSVRQIVDDIRVDQEAMIQKTSSGVYLLLGPVIMALDRTSAANFLADGFKIIGDLGKGLALVEETCSQKRYLAFGIEYSSKVSSKL
ncbi:hypothetical protein IW261DRAFT_1509696 [Armillaria novae-zelandiae]|uniref:Uncharacterized protein n=1 Tax=Armillaria novae-zelandiae TaxID=153914 RepID=A0AA39UAX2_9AGAR|nr:hypothetical protein IW261DRAFT_1509696 [Armillaria novae-zelandiae]